MPEARRDRCREVTGKKGIERVIAKAAEDELVSIPGRGPELQMKQGSDAIPDAAGGEPRN